MRDTTQTLSFSESGSRLLLCPIRMRALCVFALCVCLCVCVCALCLCVRVKGSLAICMAQFELPDKKTIAYVGVCVLGLLE